jgi:hypothetical protein
VLCCLAERYDQVDDQHRQAMEAIALQINEASVNLDPSAINLRRPKRLRAALGVACIPVDDSMLVCKCAPYDESRR